MKKQTRMNSLFPLLMAAALIALMSGCLAGEGIPDEYQPPPGYGYVRVSMGSMRTILPVNTAALASLTHFRLAFTSTDVMINGSDYYTSGNIDRTDTTLSDPIDLPVGTYNLTVNAYQDSISTATLTATAAITGITVNVSANTPLTINLQGYTSGTVNGSFEWNIDLSDLSGLLASATMVITPISPTTGSQRTVDLFASANPSHIAAGTQSNLPVGYYDVVFTLTKTPAEGGIVFTFKQILWVYRNLTSVFEFAFLDSYFTIGRYIVTLECNGFPGTPQQTFDVIRGSQFIFSIPTHPDAFAFGWYSNNGSANHTTTNGWAPEITSPYIPTKDTTLYLRWLPYGHILNNPIEIDFGDTALELEYSIAPTPSPPPATNNINNGDEIVVYSVDETVTITISNESNFSTFQWYCHDKPLGNTDSISITPSSHTDIKSVGKYPIFVTAIDNTTTKHQSFFFVIELKTGSRP